MHETGAMRRVQRFRDLGHHRDLLIDRHPQRRLGQRDALDATHGDERTPVDDARFIHIADVIVPDLRLRARLANVSRRNFSATARLSIGSKAR